MAVQAPVPAKVEGELGNELPVPDPSLLFVCYVETLWNM